MAKAKLNMVEGGCLNNETQSTIVKLGFAIEKYERKAGNSYNKLTNV